MNSGNTDFGSFTLEHPSDIYRKLSDAINTLLSKMDGTYENEAIQKTQSDGKDVLYNFHSDISRDIEQLERYSEWSKFTIAFFGETNAGKSTIIECLRIYLQERTKVEQQNKFKSKQQAFNLSDESLRQLDADVLSFDNQLNSVKDDIQSKHAMNNADNQLIVAKIATLELAVIGKKAIFTWWQKIIFIFLRLREEKEIYILTQSIKSNLAQQEHALSLLQIKEQQLHTEKKETIVKKDTQLRQLIELEPFADGSIMGDGRLDFTRKVQSFNFSINNQSIVVLDVPGIEGEEAVVEAEIAKAVTQSHAVFYITSKDAPPNTGTLDKIKSYLSDQTEVWSIYNKAINNPRALKDELVSSEDDRQALKGLDDTLRSALGKSYKHHIVLAGLPAFFAVATCVVPYSDHQKNQRKFVEAKKSAEELLKLSNFPHFHRLLISDVVGNVEFKIKKANFNKANTLLKNGVGKLRSVNKIYISLKDDLEAILTNSLKEISNNFENLDATFRRNGERVIDEFRRNTRTKIYSEIDTNIDNEVFKSRFEIIMKIDLEILQNSFEESNKKAVSEFERDIKEAIDKLNKRMESAVSFYQHRSALENMDLNLNFNIDSGINKWGLVGTAIGVAAALWWNPVGWVAGVVAAAGIIISFAKAIWSFFDSDYKKTQQRKNVDTNLLKVSDKVRESIRANINELMPKIKLELDQLNLQLKEPVEHISRVSSELEYTATHFDQLSNAISQHYGE